MTIGDANDKGVVAYKVTVQRLTANADAQRYTRFDAEVIYEQVVNYLEMQALLAVVNHMPLPPAFPRWLFDPATGRATRIPEDRG